MSYADMITILMAFFVVMYSMAGDESEQKEQAVMESLRSWLGPTKYSQRFNGDGQGGPTSGLPGIEPRLLSMEPGQDGEAGNGDSHASNWRIVHSLGGSLYLQAAQTSLGPLQQAEIERIARILSGKRQLVEVHCVPGPRWAAQATSSADVLDHCWQGCLLVRQRLAALGIEPKRMQLRVASLGSEPTDGRLLGDKSDLRIDINLSERFLPGP